MSSALWLHHIALLGGSEKMMKCQMVLGPTNSSEAVQEGCEYHISDGRLV